MARVNISIPDRLYEEAKKSHLNISRICTRAIADALLQHWAEMEQSKLLSFMNEDEKCQSK